jgi:hypothetical protein
MPRFHFEIIDGYKIEDPVGMDLKGKDRAKTLANAIAKQIAVDVGGAAARDVVVINDEGEEVYKTPIDTTK